MSSECMKCQSTKMEKFDTFKTEIAMIDNPVMPARPQSQRPIIMSYIYRCPECGYTELYTDTGGDGSCRTKLT